MQKMVELVHKAKQVQMGVDDVLVGGVEHYNAATTRLMSFFAHWRFLYFHGQRHARIVSDETVYATPKRRRSALVSFLSPLLFFAPEVHLMEMEKLWTDEVIIERAWKGFMTKLLSEWNDLILWSTVLLSVNVGFLAIPGVVPYNIVNGVLTITRQVVILGSLAQVSSVLSLEASVGSIVISLLLMRHNRTKQDADPAEAWEYLSHNSHRYIGLELMAIVFSLPWALLMWSMLMFFVALFLYCFSLSNLRSRISISSISLVVFAFFVGCMWIIWESSNKWAVWLDGLPSPIPRALRALHLSRLRDAAMSLRKYFRSRTSPRTTNDTGSEHEMATRRDGVVGGNVQC